jgi:predicted RNA-binding protein YlxR (DUF448 family)
MNHSPRTVAEPTRTCVGCGRRGGIAAADLIRLAVVSGQFDVDLRRRVPGRGSYVHGRPGCLERAATGIARRTGARRAAGEQLAGLGTRVVAAADEEMGRLLAAARRQGAVALLPSDVRAALEKPAGLGVSLAVVAADAAEISLVPTVALAIREGRALAFGTRSGLKSLLGNEVEGICAVRHPSWSRKLIEMRALADAGAAVEDALGGRRPEAR